MGALSPCKIFAIIIFGIIFISSTSLCFADQAQQPPLRQWVEGHLLSVKLLSPDQLGYTFTIYECQISGTEDRPDKMPHFKLTEPVKISMDNKLSPAIPQIAYILDVDGNEHTIKTGPAVCL